MYNQKKLEKIRGNLYKGSRLEETESAGTSEMQWIWNQFLVQIEVSDPSPSGEPTVLHSFIDQTLAESFLNSKHYFACCGSFLNKRHKVSDITDISTGEDNNNTCISSVQFSRSVVSDSETPWIASRQASLSITNSQSLSKLMSIESVMPSSHLILCRPLLFLPPIPPSIRVFSKESTLRMRWPKYWNFSFHISASSKYPGLISFRMDWLGLLVYNITISMLCIWHNIRVWEGLSRATYLGKGTAQMFQQLMFQLMFQQLMFQQRSKWSAQTTETRWRRAAQAEEQQLQRFFDGIVWVSGAASSHAFLIPSPALLLRDFTK